MIGVPRPEHVALLASVLRELGCDHAVVVHGADGLDEISTAGPTEVAEIAGDEIVLRTTTPGEPGRKGPPPKEPATSRGVTISSLCAP